MSQEVVEVFKKRLEKVRMQFLTNSKTQAFASFLLNLKQRFDFDFPSTAGVSTTEIVFNPSKCQERYPDDKGLFGLLAHEVMHEVLLHNMRFIAVQDPAQRYILNAAMDVVIDLVLESEGIDRTRGVFTVLKEWNIDKNIFVGKSTEEVYEELQKLVPKPKYSDFQQFSDLLGKPKDDLRPDGLIKANNAGQLMSSAGASSFSQLGSKFEDIKVLIDEFKNPKVNWKEALAQYAYEFCKEDYSFKRMNMSYYPKYFLPTLSGEKLGGMAVFMDTSGSIDDALFHELISVAESVRRTVQPTITTISCFDTSLHNEQTFDEFTPMSDYQPSGRGGTDLRRVMEWISKNNPNVTLIFTDGEFAHNFIRPSTDIIWIIFRNTNFKPEFGKVIYYND